MVAQQQDRSRNEVEHPDFPRIEVTELPDPGLDAWSHGAFERGYQVAVTETIASLLPAAEAFLRREATKSPEVCDALYRFERFLARRLDANTRPESWVEHGGGI